MIPTGYQELTIGDTIQASDIFCYADCIEKANARLNWWTECGTDGTPHAGQSYTAELAQKLTVARKS